MANIDLEKLTLLYEGKAKQVYATDNKDEYIVHYKDDAALIPVLLNPSHNGHFLTDVGSGHFRTSMGTL